MKRTILSLMLVMVSFYVSALDGEFALKGSNLIPYVWKISRDANLQLSQADFDIHKWPSINLGVSWERQGYFSADKELVLATYFEVPKTGADRGRSPFQLAVNLQCKVLEIYLNGNKIGENLQFQPLPSVISVPGNQLLFDKRNLIVLKITNVKWTGGVCKNSFRLTHPGFASSDSISLKTAMPANTYYEKDNLDFSVLYKSNGRMPVKLNMTVISDFRDTVATRNFGLIKEDRTFTVSLKRKLFKPGFYHIIVYTEGPFYEQRDMWIAIEPERISCSEDGAPNLKSWWDKTKLEMDSIDFKTEMTKLTDLGNSSKDVYKVEFTSLENIRITGFMFVPKKEGRFPAILHVPGYGQAYTSGSFSTNKEDVIDFAVAIRGQSPSNKVINPGFGLVGLAAYKIDNPRNYIYRGAYMDCLRALDILRSFSKTDSSRVAVMGGSQGGGLSLATAALAGNKIKACVTLCPFLCDLAHHGMVREVWQREKFYFSDAYKCKMETIDSTLRYVDVKNMASWITAKVFFASALFDDDCPSHVGFAAFNKINSEKRYKIYPNDGHMVLADEANVDGNHFLKEVLEY